MKVSNSAARLANSEFLSNLDSHLSHLPEQHRVDIVGLIYSYPTLFSDVPSCTNVLQDDIDVGSSTPIKQHAYCCPVDKREKMKAEVEYLLRHGLAKPSHSPWSSPCLLALKSDGTPDFVLNSEKSMR